MAEKVIVEGGGVAANRPTGPMDLELNETDALIEAAPEPATEGGKIYRVLYPTDQFLMEGMPLVHTGGVRLTQDQADEVLPAAEASGVRIVEVAE